MLQMFLGFVTALAAVAWGITWYRSHEEREGISPLKRFSRSNPAPSSSTPAPLVSHEAAEQLLQPRGQSKSELLSEPVEKAGGSDVTAEPTGKQQRPPAPGPVVIEGRAAQVPHDADEDGAMTSENQLQAESAPETTVQAAEPSTPIVEESAPEESESAAAEEAEEVVIGYCARCRTKRAVANPERTETKKGKPAIRGKCVECGAGMFVFTSAKE